MSLVGCIRRSLAKDVGLLMHLGSLELVSRALASEYRARMVVGHSLPGDSGRQLRSGGLDQKSLALLVERIALAG